jgi:hypothetical protein
MGDWTGAAAAVEMTKSSAAVWSAEIEVLEANAAKSSSE